MEIEKQIFKVGDTVYCKIYGKGVVDSINIWSTYPIIVDFISGKSVSYTYDGRIYDGSNQCLSFTPWTEQPNFERPIDYTEWVGKLCAFWDNETDGLRVGRLIEYRGKGFNGFRSEGGYVYNHCKLLDDQELINKIKNM